uniref:1,4-dihydroxy-2-naphthoate octaprenyltransferase n=1 Tax=Prevotella sp. GTC17254 TaxID=3236794 RepID=A0AB33IW52_9BACT
MEVQSEIKTNSAKAWMLASRPKTLTGAAVPIMVAIALAAAQLGHGTFRIVPAVLCLLFAFIMQIDANFINDYFDFIRGNDDDTRLGPRRACSQGWITPQAMKKGLIVTTFIACITGLPLIWYGGTEMVIVGLLCVAFCFLYTTKLSYIGMGDVLVLVFFGIVPVCCTYYLITTDIAWPVFIASIACGLVIDTLLLVNNYRDRKNDMAAGKHTLVTMIGETNTEWLYLACGWIAVGLNIVVLLMLNAHLFTAALPAVYLILHTRTWRKMKEINRGKALNLILGQTARNMFIYGMLTSISLLIL